MPPLWIQSDVRSGAIFARGKICRTERVGSVAWEISRATTSACRSPGSSLAASMTRRSRASLLPKIKRAEFRALQQLILLTSLPARVVFVVRGHLRSGIRHLLLPQEGQGRDKRRNVAIRPCFAIAFCGVQKQPLPAAPAIFARRCTSMNIQPARATLSSSRSASIVSFNFA